MLFVDLLLILVVLLIGGLAVGLFVIGWAMQQRAKRKADLLTRIRDHGLRAEATVTSRESHWYRRSGARYIIGFQFTPDSPAPAGTASEGSDSGVRQYGIQVPYRDYADVQEGDHFTVRYVPEDLSVVHPEGKIHDLDSPEQLRITSSVSYGAGVIVLIIAVFAIAGFASVSQKSAADTATANARLFTPNPATVTAHFSADNATAQTIAGRIAGRLRGWQKVTDQDRHVIPPTETGLNMDAVRIDYGYCAPEQFYVYVWIKRNFSFNGTGGALSDMDGYAYIEGSNPYQCRPADLALQFSDPPIALTGGWFAVRHTLQKLYPATATPALAR